VIPREILPQNDVLHNFLPKCYIRDKEKRKKVSPFFRHTEYNNQLTSETRFRHTLYKYVCKRSMYSNDKNKFSLLTRGMVTVYLFSNTSRLECRADRGANEIIYFSQNSRRGWRAFIHVFIIQNFEFNIKISFS